VNFSMRASRSRTGTVAYATVSKCMKRPSSSSIVDLNRASTTLTLRHFPTAGNYARNISLMSDLGVNSHHRFYLNIDAMQALVFSMDTGQRIRPM
jgi:hypothetical protein